MLNIIYIFSDLSSGFDSTGFSDTHSMALRDAFDSDVSSVSSQVDLLLTTGSDNKMAMFSTMHAVCDNMRLLLDMEHMCDVTFLVGFRCTRSELSLRLEVRSFTISS